MRYDLGVAWVSKGDSLFIRLLDSACQSRNLSVLQITPENLEEIIQSLKREEISLRALMDRSSDEDERFLALAKWACGHDCLRINQHEEAFRARDKAAMHLSLFQNFHVPYTIILPPYREKPELDSIDLRPVGPVFVTKPSQGGGGAGVCDRCTSIEDIQTARRQFPHDKYLVQARIVPIRLGERNAWFRVIYNVGNLYPFWWDPETHVYTPVTIAERYHYHLEPLEEITVRIAGICRLHLFSTEIALTKEGDFQIVDYVNDPIDLTPRSSGRRFMPDEVLRYLAEDLSGWLAVQLRERDLANGKDARPV